MKTYATLGPACCRADLLTELLDMGLTGFRLNLSHTTLAACRPWTEAVQQAREASGRPAELIVDMRGPELRMGPLSRPVTLTAGETVTLGPGGLLQRSQDSALRQAAFQSRMGAFPTIQPRAW